MRLVAPKTTWSGGKAILLPLPAKKLTELPIIYSGESQQCYARMYTISALNTPNLCIVMASTYKVIRILYKVFLINYLSSIPQWKGVGLGRVLPELVAMIVENIFTSRGNSPSVPDGIQSNKVKVAGTFDATVIIPTKIARQPGL